MACGRRNGGAQEAVPLVGAVAVEFVRTHLQGRTPAITPADVHGKSVAYNPFPLATQLAQEHLSGANLRKVRSRKELLSEVCLGTVAAGFEEASYLNAMLLNRPESCTGKPLAVHLVSGAAASVAFGAHRDAAMVAEELRSALNDMAVDGHMTIALDRWASFSANETRSFLRYARTAPALAAAMGDCSFSVRSNSTWMADASRQDCRAGSSAGKQRKIGLPRQHEPRNPHADERHPRHDRSRRQRIHLRTSPHRPIVESSAARSSTILTDILDLAKIEAGRFEIHPTVLHPEPCLAGVARLFEGMASAKGLQLAQSLHEPAGTALW